MASAITASIVTENELVFDAITGTPPRIIEYYIELTKAAINDWILLEGAIGDTTKTLMGVSGIVIDSSSDLVQEGFTYDDSEDKLVMTSATAGTAKIIVRMKSA